MSACVTWFKRKVLNQGLEVFRKLLILSPWLRTFLIFSYKFNFRLSFIHTDCPPELQYYILGSNLEHENCDIIGMLHF